jgi:ABC-2 type transport system permease protein
MSALELPSIPTTAWSRTGWAINDGWILVRRELWHLRSQPGQIAGALVFPVVLVVLFGYVFGSAIAVPGGGNYRAYLIPGLFSMVSVFGVMVNAMAIAADKSKGVMDRFRSMPVARAAVPFGQAGADLIVGVVSVLLMAGCGLVVGWQPHEGIARTAAALGLIILFRYALSWVGVYLGLAIKDEETLDSLGPLIFPFTMISNAFVPTSNMPTWLRTVADWNPLSAITAASRQLFGNSAAALGHTAWPLRHPVAAALLWSVLLLAVFIPLAVHRHRTAES